MNFAIATTSILENILSDVQKTFYNSTIHTKNEFICKEGLSFVILLNSLSINSRNYGQASLEELQSKLSYS